MNKQISQASIAFVISIGFLVLLGWRFDIPLFKSVFLGSFLGNQYVMKANSAFCFVLAGISVGLLRSQRCSQQLYWLAQGFALLVSTMGLLTLSQYFFGWNLGIDQWLVSGGTPTVVTPYPGRIGENTSLNFVLLGLAILLFAQKTRRSDWISQILSCLVGLIALLALIGHLFGVRTFYGFLVQKTTMIPQTAVIFLVLSTGILLSRPNRGLMQTLTSPLAGGLMARRLLPWAIALPLVLSWLCLCGEKARWYDRAFGDALHTTGIMVVFAVMIWRTAWLLNRIERDRRQAEIALKQLNESLETLVAERTAELAQKQQLLDAFVTSAPVGITVLDPQLRFSLINETLADINGISAEEHIGKTVWEILPDLAPKQEKIFQQILTTGQSVLCCEVSGETQKLPGVTRTWLVSYFPIVAQTSPIMGIGICVIEITERKQIEAALQESEQRFRTLIQDLNIGVLLQGANTEILLSNSKALELLGLTEDQLLGKTSFDPDWRVIHEDGTLFPGETHPVPQAIATRQPVRNVVMGIHRPQIVDGVSRVDLIWLLVNAEPQFIVDGQIKHVICTFSDITHCKQAQEALRQQAEYERMIGVIAQHIRHSLDLPEILNTTVAQVRHFLQTDRVIVYRFESDWSGIVVAESLGEGWQSIGGMKITDTHLVQTLGDAYGQGRTQAVEDIYEAGFTPCHVDFLAQFQVRAILIVPILQGEKLWGLLIAHHCRAPRPWQLLEIELLKQLATQLVIAIQQSELYRQLQAANHELERLAHLDGLTQIANRRCFERHLEQEWKRLAKEVAPLSLILCDIDYFKRYNDTYGHPAGDACLITVAGAISCVLKCSADLAARYGGEEFAVILPNTDSAGAAQVADTIREEIQRLYLPHAASAISEYVTVSLGIASIVPSLNSSPKMLIDAADRALYQAKQKGRNCYCLN